MRAREIIGLILALGILTGVASAALGADPPDPEQASVGQTPPRLGLVDGQVSFWRPGAPDWVPAQMNTPLAPGDELATGSPGNLELQIGARAFVRGWAGTRLGLENQAPDFLQIKVTAGHTAMDLRGLEPGYTVEVDTPNAAFRIDHPGYYRVEVSEDRTAFIARRAGQATATPGGGAAVNIMPNEEAVIEGTGTAQIMLQAAPALDDWDRWNYARTDHLLGALSARYVSPGTYGVSELDAHGTWRDEPTYGPVWVPTDVQADWVPYSTGSWVQDPSYGWTWVSAEPWGWAPFHSGRWVFVDNSWAWAPGPVRVRSVYAPALVAFFDSPGVSLGGPVVGWVALGWGEPCIPWWGPVGFRHHPWWGGWGGPRILNNLVISRTTVVNAQHITIYQNARVRNAVVVVHGNHFGHGRIREARVAEAEVHGLRPIHSPPPVAATSGGFPPTARRVIQPAEGRPGRSVGTTRPPHLRVESASRREPRVSPAEVASPAPHLVSRPGVSEPAHLPPRPLMGQRMVERPPAAGAQRAFAPRLEGPRLPDRGFASPAPVIRRPPPPRHESQAVGRSQAVRLPARLLSSNPANRLSADRAGMRLPRREQRPASPHPVRPHGAPPRAPRERRGG